MSPLVSFPQAKRPTLDHHELTCDWSGSADMAYDVDIFCAAKLVIERHGSNAVRWASQRVHEFLVEEDAIGVDLWRDIQGAIEGLQQP